ncbi:MAG: HD domain-containing protein [bacterium]|nr:HD domain-containing protein [bacterium]
MNKDYYEIVKERILNQIDSEEYKKAYVGKEQGKVDRRHFLEVVHIVKELWTQQEKIPLPTALKIAALCHDSDRIYPTREVNTKDCPEELYEYRKGVHSGNTALILFENNLDLPRELIRDACYLILRHEKGGDRFKDYTLIETMDEFTNTYNLNRAADYLWWADKMSFFFSNIVEYANRGKEKLQSKILYSLEGLPSFAVQKISKKDYPPAIKESIDKVLQKLSEKHITR